MVVNDNNGCNTSETVVITEADLLTSSFTTSDWNGFEIQCNGGDNGEIVLNVLGGVTGQSYSYTIDGASHPSNIFSNLTAGTYVVSSTDVNGCATSEIVSMTEPTTAITSSFTQSDYNGFGVSCNGDTDGSIDLIVDGGLLPYTFAWSNSATSEDLNILGAGTYSVVVNDNNGCTTTETVVITEPVALTSSYSQSDYNGFGVSCNGYTDGSIDLTVTGGVDSQNYTYTWSNAATSEDLNGLGAGTYSVVVNDNNGCNTSETVVISEPLVFVGASFGSDQTICEGEILNIISILTPSSGGNPPYTYDWEIDDGTGFTSINNDNLSSFQPQPLADTTVYKIIHSDAYQCNTFTQLITTVVNPLPISYPIIGNLNPCSNESSLEYTLSQTPSNYRYEWFLDPNDGTIIGTNESRKCLINWPSNPGSIVNLEVDVWIEETGCHIAANTSTSIELSNNEAPSICIVELKPNSTILACSDSTVGIQYQWGYDVISTGNSFDLVGETLQYVQLSSIPDTNIERYWVDTYFTYPDNITCKTRSYYNAPPDPISDIDEININDFNIYPNPVKDKLYFEYESSNQVELEVFDLLGRKVDCDIDYDNNSISVIGRRTGVYMLLVKSNKNEFIKKFIVKQ